MKRASGANIRQDMRDAVEHIMQTEQGNATTQQIFEPLIHAQETQELLQQRIKQLAKENERHTAQIRAQGKRNFDVVELHRKHTQAVVFSGNNTSNLMQHMLTNAAPSIAQQRATALALVWQAITALVKSSMQEN